MGHNQTTCPDKKAYIKANPNGHYARHEKLKEQNRKKRACSYCGETGHNRRSCKALKADKEKLYKKDKEFRVKFSEALKNVGFGPGSLVSFDSEVRVEWGEYTPVKYIAMIKSINWDGISMAMAKQDISKDYRIARLEIGKMQVVSTVLTDESRNRIEESEYISKFDWKPSPNNYEPVRVGSLLDLLGKGVFATTDYEVVAKHRENFNRKWGSVNILSRVSKLAIPDSLGEREPAMLLLNNLNIVPVDKDEWSKARSTGIDYNIDYYVGEQVD